MKITHKDAPFDHHLGKPDTTWHFTLAAICLMVAASWLIYTVATGLIDVSPVVDALTNQRS